MRRDLMDAGRHHHHYYHRRHHGWGRHFTQISRTPDGDWTESPPPSVHLPDESRHVNGSASAKPVPRQQPETPIKAQQQPNAPQQSVPPDSTVIKSGPDGQPEEILIRAGEVAAIHTIYKPAPPSNLDWKAIEATKGTAAAFAAEVQKREKERDIYSGSKREYRYYETDDQFRKVLIGYILSSFGDGDNDKILGPYLLNLNRRLIDYVLSPQFESDIQKIVEKSDAWRSAGQVLSKYDKNDRNDRLQQIIEEVLGSWAGETAYGLKDTYHKVNRLGASYDIIRNRVTGPFAELFRSKFEIYYNEYHVRRARAHEAAKATPAKPIQQDKQSQPAVEKAQPPPPPPPSHTVPVGSFEYRFFETIENVIRNHSATRRGGLGSFLNKDRITIDNKGHPTLTVSDSIRLTKDILTRCALAIAPIRDPISLAGNDAAHARQAKLKNDITNAIDNENFEDLKRLIPDATVLLNDIDRLAGFLKELHGWDPKQKIFDLGSNGWGGYGIIINGDVYS